MTIKKITNKLYDLTPDFVFRLTDSISSKYNNLTSSFSNWRNGYGWFPDSETWSLNSTISRFVLPRLRRFIKRQGHSTPYPFYEMEDGNEKWIEVLKKIQVAFMEEEEWFRWKYPNQKHPIYDVDFDSSIPLAVETDNKHLLEFNPKWIEQFDSDEANKYTNEYYKEYKESCKLLGEYFGNLWD